MRYVAQSFPNVKQLKTLTIVRYVAQSFLNVKQAKNLTTVQFAEQSFLIVKQEHLLLKINLLHLVAKQEVMMLDGAFPALAYLDT